MSTSNSNSGNPSGATPKVVVRKMPFVRPAWADEEPSVRTSERPGVYVDSYDYDAYGVLGPMCRRNPQKFSGEKTATSIPDPAKFIEPDDDTQL